MFSLLAKALDYAFVSQILSIANLAFFDLHSGSFLTLFISKLHRRSLTSR